MLVRPSRTLHGSIWGASGLSVLGLGSVDPTTEASESATGCPLGTYAPGTYQVWLY